MKTLLTAVYLIITAGILLWALVFIKPGLKTKKVRIRGRSRVDVVLKKARYRKVVQPDEDLPPDPN